MLRLRLRPGFWLGGFIFWFAVLWILSSRSGANEDLPSIVHIDKVAHFVYFFGGGFLLAAYFYRRNPQLEKWTATILKTWAILAIVGAIDEYHQTFTPGRSGGDVYDWLADIAGAVCGALFLRSTHRAIK